MELRQVRQVAAPGNFGVKGIASLCDWFKYNHMKKYHYVWEKMFVAIECLCYEGPFKERLQNATISALIQLRDEDLDSVGELKPDLKFILDWTKGNIENGQIQRLPDEIQRRQLVDKMVHVLVETTRLQEEGRAQTDRRN
jgi:hypothetical protein